MKSASVADPRNDFACFSRCIPQGEEVSITERGEDFTTFFPAAAKLQKKRKRIVWPDFGARISRLEDDALLIERNCSPIGTRTQSARARFLLSTKFDHVLRKRRGW